MKLQTNQILVHAFALLGTSALWLAIGQGIQFVIKGSVNHQALLIHALATTLISYSLDVFRQCWMNRDFTLITLFRPLVSSASLSHSSMAKAPTKRNPHQ